MARVPAHDPFRIPFQRADGVTRPEAPYGEPGTWHDNTDKESVTGCMPILTQITDYQLGGTDPSTGLWTAVVTPILDPLGSAASNGEGPASISFTADSDALDAVVAGLVAAADTGATLDTPDDLAAWSRFRSYVALSVSPVDDAHLRATATASGATFSILITPPAGESSTVTVAAIAAPSTDTLRVGTYVALDADRSGGAHNNQGQPFLELITSSTAAADYLGPVMLGNDTMPLDPGDLYQRYAAGKSASLARYGHPRAYGEKAIPNTSVATPVYVRHTAVGNFVAGTVTDAAGAALLATADVWTGTPTSANDTVFTEQITFNGNVVNLTYLSDAGSSATEITTGLKAELAKYNGVGGPLYGLTGTGTTTFIITGPADGRSFTAVTLGAGIVTWVHTTTGVTTHTIHPRGDKFLAASPGAGSVPISIPHP
jgi:hypothetical protein